MTEVGAAKSAGTSGDEGVGAAARGGGRTAERGTWGFWFGTALAVAAAIAAPVACSLFLDVAPVGYLCIGKGTEALAGLYWWICCPLLMFAPFLLPSTGTRAERLRSLLLLLAGLVLAYLMLYVPVSLFVEAWSGSALPDLLLLIEQPPGWRPGHSLFGTAISVPAAVAFALVATALVRRLTTTPRTTVVAKVLLAMVVSELAAQFTMPMMGGLYVLLLAGAVFIDIAYGVEWR